MLLHIRDPPITFHQTPEYNCERNITVSAAWSSAVCNVEVTMHTDAVHSEFWLGHFYSVERCPLIKRATIFILGSHDTRLLLTRSCIMCSIVLRVASTYLLVCPTWWSCAERFLSSLDAFEYPKALSIISFHRRRVCSGSLHIKETCDDRDQTSTHLVCAYYPLQCRGSSE